MWEKPYYGPEGCRWKCGPWLENITGEEYWKSGKIALVIFKSHSNKTPKFIVTDYWKGRVTFIYPCAL